MLTGIFGTDEEALAKSDGLNINLWTGLGMVAVAAIFQTWARLRPVVVPDDTDAATPGSGRDEEG